jgi:hypothetical protein
LPFPERVVTCYNLKKFKQKVRVANWYFSIPDFANLVFSRGIWYWKFWSGIEAKKWYFLVFWKNVKARN